MIDWQNIDTALLDMDGTLLDLAYDNWFWRQHVPEQYAQANKLSIQAAYELIEQWIHRHHGTLNWYCLDFWSNELNLNIAKLKEETSTRIKPRPGAEKWLDALKKSGRRVIMATNAHPDALRVKVAETGIDQYFDELVTSHDYGAAKESQGFWQSLQQHHPFDPQRSLFVDDSIAVLNSAAQFGIAHLACIKHPDSSEPPRTNTAPFIAIDRYEDVMPTPPTP